MKVLNKLSALTATLLLAACSSESERGLSDNPSLPSDGNDVIRREVLMTLKNRFQVAPVSKAGGIATDAENHIRTLDVYVFGSDTEDGDYTFQERFAYRENSGDIPNGVTSLDLEVKGMEGTETTTLLSLKKGLFVKLYCVANQPDLVNPAKIGNNGIVSPSDFSSLELTTPGQSGTTIAKAGVPTLTDFLTFHTPLLNAASAADTLVTPLPMTAAYTTPLDLTDFTVSARTQIGFKLSRMVSRFDITNNASESKFTIESISMAKGRRGASLFPIKVYAGTPADATDLITYPSRLFWGDKANIGTQTGAFYTWPSLIEDGGYLILKGKYHVNQTETKEVTYQVPFKQNTSDGSGTYLEITHNHRYTIGITKADEYHLDFNLTVSDWTDGGNLDDYTPEDEGKANILVTIPAADDKTQYEENTKTVTLSLAPNSYFDMEIQSGATLTLKKNYVGGPEYQQYDWLTIETDPDILTKADVLSKYNCKVSLNKDYTGERFPRAVLRFQNTVDGTENVFFIDPLSAPQVMDAVITGTGNYNKYDKEHSEISLYRTTECDVQLKVVCVEDITVEAPEWLSVENTSRNNLERIYTLKLKDANEVVAGDEGILTLKNARFETLTTSLQVKLLKTDITVSNQNIAAANSGVSSISVTSPEGCDASLLNNSWNGGGQWFDISKSSASAGSNTVAVTQRNNQNTSMKAVTIRLTNKIKGGKSADFALTPTFSKPVLNATSGTLSAISGNEKVIPNYKSLTFTFTRPAGNIGSVTSSNTSVATVSVNGTTVTVTAVKRGSATINVPNGSDPSLISTYNVTVGYTTVRYNGNVPGYYGSVLMGTSDLSSGMSRWNAQSACPSGWRLPTSGEANGFWNNTTINDMISRGWLMSRPSGQFDYVNWWTGSGTADGNIGYVYYFAGGSVYGFNDTAFNKDSALRVRCVRTP